MKKTNKNFNMKKTVYFKKTFMAVALLLATMMSITSVASPDKKKGASEQRPNLVTIGTTHLSVISAVASRAEGIIVLYLEDGKTVSIKGSSVLTAGSYTTADARSAESPLKVVVRSLRYSPVQTTYTYAQDGDVAELTVKGTTAKDETIDVYYRGKMNVKDESNGKGHFACGKEKSKLNVGWVCYEDGNFRYYLSDKGGVAPVRIVMDKPIMKKEYDLAKDTNAYVEISDPSNPDAVFIIRNGLLKIKRKGSSFSIMFEAKTPLGEMAFDYSGEAFVNGAFKIEYDKSEVYYTEPPYEKGKTVVTPQYRLRAQ